MASPEQQAIITTVGSGHNVYADAVAGSGKTTTVLWMARQYPMLKILQVTYNSQLKNEVREKSKKLNLENIKIHTYHSLARSHYNRSAYTDIAMNDIIYLNVPPLEPLPQYNIMVIDEAQDMSPLYYSMVQKFIKDSGTRPRMLVIGDRFQGIYAFKLSDTRFLTLAPQIYDHMGPFRALSLTQSYRITVPMAEFVNKILVGGRQDRIQSMRPSEHPVTLIKCNFYKEVQIRQIVNIIMKLKADPGDIFILSPSIHKYNSVKQIENILVKKNVQCYVPSRDEGTMDERVIKGKLCITTFHQSKGRERKYVFVMGFDQSYMNFYAAEYDKNICPPAIYVACTRATDRLFVIENQPNGRLSFIRRAPELYPDFVNIIPLEAKPAASPSPQPSPSDRPRNCSPTDLIRFLSEKDLDKIQKIIVNIIAVTIPIQTPINIPGVAMMVNGSQIYYEEVADLNGVAIPAMFESRFSTPQIYLNLIDRGRVKNDFIDSYIKNLPKWPKKLESIHDFLYTANIHQAYYSGYHFKLNQIKHYDWLKPTKCAACLDYMAANVKIPYHAEVGLSCQYKYRNRDRTKVRDFCINGRIDADDGETIWEFKCVEEIILEHQIQLAIYAYIYLNNPDASPRAFKLLNIRTGEVQTLTPDMNALERIMRRLLKAKNRDIRHLEDAQFVEKMIKLRK